MAKKSAAAPRHVEPKDESQDVPDADTGERKDEVNAGKRMSKAKAVKEALAAGKDGPQDGTAYIRNTFGIDVTPQHFSAVKSQLKKREGGTAPQGERGRKPKRASQAVEGYLAPPPKTAPDRSSDLLDALEAMKPLVASLGKEQVKRIVDLLG